MLNTWFAGLLSEARGGKRGILASRLLDRLTMRQRLLMMTISDDDDASVVVVICIVLAYASIFSEHPIVMNRSVLRDKFA